MTVTSPKLVEYQRLWANVATRDEARAYAKAYVNQYRAQLEGKYKDLSIDALVPMLSAYRAAGRDEDVVIIDMWLQSEFPIQHITAQVNAPGSQVTLTVAQQALLAQAEAIVAEQAKKDGSE